MKYTVLMLSVLVLVGCISTDADTSDAALPPCTETYKPVCGKLQVQCVRAPCNPVWHTFKNACEADRSGATNVREGVCE